MRFYLTFSCGIVLASLFPIPQFNFIILWGALVLLLGCCLLKIRQPIILLLAVFGIAYAYASWRISLRWQQMPQQPIHQLLINGFLRSPPQQKGDYSQAEFTLTGSSLKAKNLLIRYPPNLKIQAGHNYQLVVNVLPLDVPADFKFLDYRLYLFSQNLTGMAYVQQITRDNGRDYSIASQINHFRVSFIAYLRSTLPQNSVNGLIIALLTGWQELIPPEQWEIYKASGIIHIISISGLHITLIAVLVGILSRFLLSFLPLFITPEQIIMIWSGVIAAGIYAGFSGFSIPAQRSFYLLLLSAYLLTCRRHIPLLSKLSIILGLILALDPFAVSSIGFWYSFSLVSIIFISTQLNHPSQSRLIRWLQLQLAITLISAILSLFLFASFPLVSILANLWAIPLIGNLFTPWLLAAGILHWDWALSLGATLLNYAVLPLKYLAQIPPYLQAKPNFASICLALIGLSILIPPWPFKAKNFLAGLFLAAILIPAHFNSLSFQEIQIQTLADNECASALIFTQNKTLLITIGQHSKSCANHLQYTLYPYLTTHGIYSIDYVLNNQSQTNSLNYLIEHQIKVQRQEIPPQLWLDGIEFNNLSEKSEKQKIALAMRSRHLSNYIGDGFFPFNSTDFNTLIILYPLHNLDWLYTVTAENLLINYSPRQANQIHYQLENLCFPAMQIWDLTRQKEILVRNKAKTSYPMVGPPEKIN